MTKKAAIMRLSARLQSMAQQLDRMIEKESGKRMAWSLQVWPETGSNSDEMIYIGNCSRAEVKRAMEECIAKWDTDSRLPPHMRRQ